MGWERQMWDDGPAVCDNCPSTMGQQTQLSCHEFGFGNDWAKILKSAMNHWWATKKRAPHTMGQPTLAGVYGGHAVCPCSEIASCDQNKPYSHTYISKAATVIHPLMIQ